MKPFVYITRQVPNAIFERLTVKYEVETWKEADKAVPREILLDKASKADALLTVITDVVDEELFYQAASLKVVANMAVGVDNIDLDAASRHGVSICNTPDVLTDTTADLTFSLLLATARRVTEAAEFVKEGKWASWAPMMFVGTDVHHKKIGIVGMGKIGTAVAKRAAGFDMDILYHNRNRHEVAEEMLGAQYCSLEELLTEADFIVCLAPLNDDTRGLFQREHFQKMKNDAIFINASRGSIINEQALIEALEAKEIAGAGLDVFDKEPIQADHPFLAMKNVVALPHIGSASKETRMAMMRTCCENIEDVLDNRHPRTLVNKEVLHFD